jgi:hypothetical protein
MPFILYLINSYLTVTRLTPVQNTIASFISGNVYMIEPTRYPNIHSLHLQSWPFLTIAPTITPTPTLTPTPTPTPTP